MTTAIADREPASTPSAPVGQRPVRLAVFTSHPIQYQAPLFRALAASDRIAPRVYFGSRHGVDVSRDRGFGADFRWDIPLLDGYEHVFLDNVAGRRDVSAFSGVRVRGIGREWRRGAFDAALVLGWHTAAHVQALLAARRAGIPILLRGESTLRRAPDHALRARLRRAAWLPVREHLYASLFRHASAFLTIGTRNAEYYRHFRVPPEKLYSAPYCVDNAHFALAASAREAARREVRARLGVADDATVVVSSAKLIPKKRPLDLLEAFARAARDDGHLLFLGEGAERARLEVRARDLGLAGRVTVSGFINQSEMPDWYAAADVLVLPSGAEETWGLAVNEGMAAGLPVIVSDAVGCAPDLVEVESNGFVFPCGDVDALAALLARLARSPALRQRFGARSREIIADFTLDRVVTAVERAVADVVGSRSVST